jgi:ribosomal protein S11
MAATTSLIIAGASAAASAGQAIAANKRRKEADFAAKDAAAKLRGISETDYSAGLQVPTMGYDLAQEGVQQQVATGVQALQEQEQLALLVVFRHLHNNQIKPTWNWVQIFRTKNTKET